MLAILFLIAAALLGFAILRMWAGVALTLVEQVAAGLVVGWMLIALATYFVARVVGALSWNLVCAVTIATLIAATGIFWRGWPRGQRALSKAEKNSLSCVLLFFTPIFCALFFTRMLPERAEGIYSGGTSFYDMAFHMAISTSFLYGRNFPPVYTLLPPEPALYPLLPDFFTAAVVAGGMNFHGALCATGVVLATALLAIFYFFARRLLSTSPLAAAVATFLFFLNGGLGFPISKLADQHIQWTNLIVDALLPQRAILFGLPASLIALAIFAELWRYWPNKSWSILGVAGALTGLLPLFHTHSYLAMMFVSAVLFLLRPRWAWCAFWIPALLLASPHLLHVAQHAREVGNMRFQPGWLGHADSNWLFVFIRNLGLPLLLIIPAWLKASRASRNFYLPFVALLGVSLIFVFTPNDTDNLKLIFYWYAATCVLIGQWLVRLALEFRQRIAALALTLLCIAPGLLALWHEAFDRQLMFSRTQMDAAEFVRSKTAPGAIFVTGPELHQPLVSLAGRATVRGATAWLWSHGYDFRAREADVRRIYAATSDAAGLLAYYRANYIYLSDFERRELHANEAALDAQFPLLYQKGGIKIYSVPAYRNEVTTRDFAERSRKDPAAVLQDFPERSYFLYRLYLVSLGRSPHYEEFMRDLPALEQDKQAFLRKWTNQEAALLQKAVEDRQLYKREYDAAYLLMHYFGYLRRDPSDAPDNSLEGYTYWLSILKRTHDYRSLSRAFLDSMEYRNRPVTD